MLEDGSAAVGAFVLPNVSTTEPQGSVIRAGISASFSCLIIENILVRFPLMRLSYPMLATMTFGEFRRFYVVKTMR